MGCFSFKCQKCGRGVKSSSFSGEKAHLFLLKEGKVIQKMTGEYDSYGRVFKDDTQRSDVKHDLRESYEWEDPFPETPNTRDFEGWVWHRVCDLMHDEENINNGIAAFHVSCYDGIEPTVRSVSDPNQGWGDDDAEEEDECYFGGLQGEGHEYPLPRPIKGYDVIKDHRIGYLESKIWRLKNDVSSNLEMIKIYLDNPDKHNTEDMYKKMNETKNKKIEEYEKELATLK